jgi:hypothetical protein
MLVVAGIVLAGGVLVLGRNAAAAPPTTADPADAILKLQARVDELERRVPDQAIGMTHVAYHFTNLWFAARDHNWPLADFYLGEVRTDVKWTVGMRPVRKGPAGDVDLSAIAQAVDSTEFAKIGDAIHRRRTDEFVPAYDETLTACFACHKAIGKPYLRPQRPTAADERIINRDPVAKWPP